MFLFPQPRSVENLEGTLVLPVGAVDADLVTFFRRVRDGESGIRVEKDAALEREEYRIEVGEDAAAEKKVKKVETLTKAEEKSKENVKALVCIIAFIQSARSLDLVLTPTGFGVVSKR